MAISFRAVRRLCVGLWLAPFSMLTPRAVWSQRVSLATVNTQDTSLAHAVRLRDGSTLVGRIVSATGDSVQVRLRAGSLTVAASDVVEVTQFPRVRLHEGTYWPENPVASRLLFAPTAFPLGRGDVTYTNLWLFIHGAAVGITDRFTLAGGFTLIPEIDFADNVFYVAPKLTVVDAAKFKLALGGIFGWAPGLRDVDFSSDNFTGGIFYGMGSLGNQDTNLNFGLGWWYGGGQVADRPVVIGGGQGRISRRVSLISEEWLATDNGDLVGVMSYGLRFLGERLSADLAFVNATDGTGFPGIPWLSLSVKF